MKTKLNSSADTKEQRAEERIRKLLRLPEEWDFRSIPDDQIEMASIYEYARDCLVIKEMVHQWKSASLPGWRLSGTEEQPIVLWGKESSELVGEIIKRPAQEIPQEVWDAAVELAPKELCNSVFFRLALTVPEFPLPWLRLSRAKRAELVEFEDRNKRAPFALSRQIRLSPYLNSIFHVEIDWSASETAIVNEFKEWLTPLYKRFGRPKKKKSGKQVNKATSALKWLAAHRLHSCALNHKEVNELIARLKKVPNPNDILPKYDGAGAYVKSVRDAEQHLAKIYPKIGLTLQKRNFLLEKCQ